MWCYYSFINHAFHSLPLCYLLFLKLTSQNLIYSNLTYPSLPICDFPVCLSVCLSDISSPILTHRPNSQPPVLSVPIESKLVLTDIVDQGELWVLKDYRSQMLCSAGHLIKIVLSQPTVWYQSISPAPSKKLIDRHWVGPMDAWLCWILHSTCFVLVLFCTLSSFDQSCITPKWCLGQRCYCIKMDVHDSSL